MSVTQFIGPRQAPLWADPVEWNSTRTYEPYTFVTYQGDSYCSRQTVPLGVQITNGKYWVKVSDFNAQAAAMQRSMTQTIETAENDMAQTIETAENNMAEQVNAVNAVKNEFQAQLDNINTITPIANQVAANNYTGNILLIGDSYMWGYSRGEDGKAEMLDSYGMQIQNWFNNNTNRHVYMTYQGGYSFSNGDWTTLFNTFCNTLTNTEKASIHDVYVCGGANDRHNTAEVINKGIARFVNAMKAQLPYARLHIVFIGAAISLLATYHTDTYQENFRRVCNAYAYNANTYGYSFVNASGVVKCNALMSTDYFHPNQTGQNRLAWCILNVIMGAEPITYAYNSAVTVHTGDIVGSTQGTDVVTYTDAKYQLSLYSTNPFYAGANPWNIYDIQLFRFQAHDLAFQSTITENTILDLGTLDNEGIYQAPGRYKRGFHVHGYCTLPDSAFSNTYYPIEATLYISQNHAYLEFNIANYARHESGQAAYVNGNIAQITLFSDYRSTIPTPLENF